MALSWSSFVAEAADDDGDSGLVWMTVVSLLETTTTSDDDDDSPAAAAFLAGSEMTEMEEDRMTAQIKTMVINRPLHATLVTLTHRLVRKQLGSMHQ